jgi:hypothetical protein
VRKRDDCSLSPQQLAKIRAEAERALDRAGAIGRFPTPVQDIIKASGLTEEPEAILDVAYLSKLRHKAGDLLKSALKKVIGVLDVAARVIAVDRSIHVVRQTFVRLHETAHGFLSWQRKLYAVVEEDESTISPDIAELFDREANAFASEVLFQGRGFTKASQQAEFGLKVPLMLGRRYGASAYSAIRRYVSESSTMCVVLVLDVPELVEGDGFQCNLRRVVASTWYTECFDDRWPETFTPSDRIGAMVPIGGRKMTGRRSLELVDKNGGRHECVAEGFTQGYQVFVLIHVGSSLRPVLVPASGMPSVGASVVRRSRSNC